MDRCVHICLNGHTLITNKWITGEEFCEKCGAKMLDRCPSCGNVIREWDYGGIIVLAAPNYERASYCKHCSKPYPWTQTAVDVATELIQEEKELDALLQEKLISAIPDLLVETPKTKVAVARFKKALSAVGKFTAEGLRQFVIDFGCEFARQQLGL